MSAMLFALIFPRARRASTFDIYAERNVSLQSALRSLVIVYDYMETALFAIACNLRSSIRDRLRSFAIIGKPAFRRCSYNIKYVLSPLLLCTHQNNVNFHCSLLTLCVYQN